eukprot:gene13171-15180_t
MSSVPMFIPISFKNGSRTASTVKYRGNGRIVSSVAPSVDVFLDSNFEFPAGGSKCRFLVSTSILSTMKSLRCAFIALSFVAVLLAQKEAPELQQLNTFITLSQVISLSLIQITIKVKDCLVDSWTTLSGGSSLRMELTHESANPGSCSLQCITGEDYIYHCSMPNTPPKGCNSLCGYNVSATVDFEHFTAFDEVAGLGYGLNKLVLNHPLPPLTASDPNFKPKPNERRKMKIVCCVPAEPSVTQESSTIPYSQAYNTLSTSLSVRATLDRFAAVYFVGSSHIRYLWDAIVHDYYNASALLTQLPQHHADETIANTWYINNYFLMELPILLQDICTEGSAFAPASTTSATSKSSSIGKTLVFVIETGAWDLDFNPAQNILLFPNSSTAVVDAILAMARNDFRCNGYKVEFVWLTSVPIPECLDVSGGVKSNNRRQSESGATSGRRKEKSCFDKGYRNNYAIRAINQYFMKAFETQSKALQVPVITPAANKNKRKSTKKKASLPVAESGSTPSNGDGEACSSVNGKQNAVNLHPHPRVRIVDAYEAIYPYRNDNVCGLHYLCCKHYGKTRVEMQYSPGGVEWMAQVLGQLAQIANIV